jgi:1-deoxy-D-xylulose-5-phosphate synthase
MFDIPMLRCLPNLMILQPKDADELKAMLEMALAQDGPVAIRYPKGSVPAGSVSGVGLKEVKAEVLSGEGAPLQIWALGDQVLKALEVAGILAEKGVSAGVVNARLVKPVDVELLRRQVAAGVQIVTLENGALAGGIGSAVQEALPEASVMRFGWPDAFVAQGTIGELEAAHGLTAQQIATRLCDMRHSIAESRTTCDIRQPTAGRQPTIDSRQPYDNRQPTTL